MQSLCRKTPHQLGDERAPACERRAAVVSQRSPRLAPGQGPSTSTGRAVARRLGVGLVPGSAVDSLHNWGEARNLLPRSFDFRELLSL